MKNEEKTGAISKARDLLFTVKEYWTEPPKGNYIPYKEIVKLFVLREVLKEVKT